MLRRTQADILSTLLPARHDYVVYCTPTVHQAQHYEAVAEQVLRYAQLTAILRMVLAFTELVSTIQVGGLEWK
jgi:SNF2 family DNA or RNA helicase